MLLGGITGLDGGKNPVYDKVSPKSFVGVIFAIAS